MEKVAGDYQVLQGKFDNLVGKALNLAKESMERVKLQPLERALIK
jgi:hypothetical protein